MARVPLVSGPQGVTQAQNGGYLREVDTGATGRAVGQALGKVSDVLERKAIRDDEIANTQADAAVAGDWMAKDVELRGKYQGVNVDQYQAEAAKWWKDAAGVYGKELSERGKAMLGNVLGRRQAVALGNVAQHVNVEKERAADQSAQANIETSIQFGVTSGDVAGASARVRQLAAEVGARKGWTTEQVQAEQGKHLSSLHLAQISKLAEANATAAQAYYDANKAEVGFAQQPRVEQILKGATDNQFATQFAAGVAAKPLAEQLAATAGIKDPERREKAITQVKTNHGLVMAAKQEQERKFSDEAWQMVGKGQKVPEIILAGMDGRERVQLQDHLRQRAEHLATLGNKPVRTDPVTLAKVYDLIRDKPDEFKALRMESLTYKLAGSDIEQVARIQRDMLDPAKEKDAVSLSAQLGPYTDTMNKNDKALFEAKAFQQVIEFQTANKRPPSSKERQEMLDGLKMEAVTHKGVLWDSTSPRFKLTPEQEAKVARTAVQVKTEADYNALPKGARYVAPDGTTRTKQ